MKRIALIIKIILIIVLIMFLYTGKVKAVYQSTLNTHANPASKTWDTWLSGMRTMEATGGAFGLTETLSGTTATSESNNIDVHMAKATEYGAVAILSASGYGNLNNTTKPETSTADISTENKTGIYYNYNNWEFVACRAAEEMGDSFSKYLDKYNTLNLRGLSPSQTWHGGTAGRELSTASLHDISGYSGGMAYIRYGSTVIGYAGTRLSVGQNGIFSYNWDASNSGYVFGDPWNSGICHAGTYYSPSSFYARGAAVNITGV